MKRGFLSPERLAEIRSIPIDKVARALSIEIKRNKALCFRGHDKKTPSLNFNVAKGVYYCFGCGVKGNVIKLVMDALQIDFRPACDWLIGHFCSPEIQPAGFQAPKVAPPQPAIATQQVNPEIYEWIVARYPLSPKAKVYLHQERKISLGVIQEMEISSIEHPRIFFSELRGQFDDQALLDCGLAKHSSIGTLVSIWPYPGILFPFRDLDFNIYYLQLRPYNQSIAKFLNLAGRSPRIYNLSRLHQINPSERIVICEGITDTLSALTLGHHAMGILGAHSFRTQDVTIFDGFQVYIMPDADRAGNQFYSKIKKAFQECGQRVQKFIVPGGYKDLNEFLVKRNSGFQ